MHASAARMSAIKPFQAASIAPRGNRRSMQVSCAAMPEQPGRRGMLAGLAGSLAVLPLINTAPAEAKLVDKVIPAKSLSAFQRKDVIAAFQVRSFEHVDRQIKMNSNYSGFSRIIS